MQPSFKTYKQQIVKNAAALADGMKRNGYRLVSGGTDNHLMLVEVAFVAIDEIQLAADFDRGHVFTDRILNLRGYAETLLIGAETMRRLVE